MKKVLALALGMLLIPFTAFGMQTMDEAAMDSITGQSGVAITVANIGIYSSGETVWYQGGSTTHWLGLQDAASVTLIDPNTNPQALIGEIGGIDFERALLAGDNNQAYVASPLIIQTSDNIAQFGGTEVPGVVITLGTLDIRTYNADSAMNIGMGNPTAGFNANGTFGRMSTGDSRTVILGGQIFIAPAASVATGNP